MDSPKPALTQGEVVELVADLRGSKAVVNLLAAGGATAPNLSAFAVCDNLDRAATALERLAPDLTPLAVWMTNNGFATGHADALADMVAQLPERLAGERGGEAVDAVGAAEREIGRYVYNLIEARGDAKPGTPEGIELAYLADLVADVEEHDADKLAVSALRDAISPAPQPLPVEVEREALDVLGKVLDWASKRCPCGPPDYEYDEPKICPLCRADRDTPGDGCKAVNETIPRDLLTAMNEVLTAHPALGGGGHG